MISKYNLCEELKPSTHAVKRFSQRQIKEQDVDIVINFGEMILQSDGTVLYFMSKKIFEMLVKAGELTKSMNKIVGLVVVMEDNLIITSYKSYDDKKLFRLNKSYKRFKQN